MEEERTDCLGLLRKTKPVLFTVLYLVLFFVIEIVASFGVLIYRVSTDIDYANRFLNALETVDMNSAESFTEYMMVYYELVPDILIVTGVLSIIPITIYFIIKKTNPFKKLSISKVWFLVILSFLLNIIVSALVECLPQWMLDDYSQSVVGYLDNLPLIPLFISVGIIGPITEEVFFRYLMMKRIKNKYVAIILPALAFGVAHGNIVQSSYATLLGLVFGYIYYKTQNLTTTSIMHITINSTSVLLPAILATAGASESIQFTNIPVMIIASVLVLLLAAHIVYAKINKKEIL